MILIVDNYDSFTYNLYHMIASCDVKVEVVRNDSFDVSEVLGGSWSGVIFSPGPGRPSDAGFSFELLSQLQPHMPVLGVCLGHQLIAEASGATLFVDDAPMHGKSSLIEFNKDSQIFLGIKSPFAVGRYHSLCVSRKNLPNDLKITAELADGKIMAIEHQSKPWYGVQFHPESLLCPQGGRLIENFIAITKGIKKNARTTFSC